MSPNSTSFLSLLSQNQTKTRKSKPNKNSQEAFWSPFCIDRPLPGAAAGRLGHSIGGNCFSLPGRYHLQTASWLGWGSVSISPLSTGFSGVICTGLMHVPVSGSSCNQLCVSRTFPWSHRLLESSHPPLLHSSPVSRWGPSLSACCPAVASLLVPSPLPQEAPPSEGPARRCEHQPGVSHPLLNLPTLSILYWGLTIVVYVLPPCPLHYY